MKKKIINNFSSLLIFALALAVFYLVRADNSWALSGTYVGRTDGEPVRALSDWNYLLEDFIAKDGTQALMSGNLEMNSHNIEGLSTPGISPNEAASREYVNSLAGSGGKDYDGSGLSVVCGKTPGGLGWQKDSTHNYIYVDTRSDSLNNNFSSAPYYIISIGGDSQHFYYGGYPGQGSMGEFSLTGVTNQGFTLNIDLNWDIVTIENLKWYVNWCGIGPGF